VVEGLWLLEEAADLGPQLEGARGLGPGVLALDEVGADGEDLEFQGSTAGADRELATRAVEAGASDRRRQSACPHPGTATSTAFSDRRLARRDIPYTGRRPASNEVLQGAYPPSGALEVALRGDGATLTAGLLT